MLLEETLQTRRWCTLIGEVKQTIMICDDDDQLLMEESDSPKVGASQELQDQ